MCDGCNIYFLCWAIFFPFTTLTTQKITLFKKMKKTPGDIIILHMCTKNYDHMMYSSGDMVRDGWMDRRTDGRTDGRTEKVTYREVGAPPKNIKREITKVLPEDKRCN